MTIFFTADTHFGHTNIIKYCGRPFETKEEHDEAIITNWNSVVQKDDYVYHLGDFGFGHPKRLQSICSRLKGGIHLLRGNHDKNLSQIENRFETIKDVHFIRTKLDNNSNFKEIMLFLSHYPHRTWPHRPKNAYHLFGHVHGNMGPYGLSFDVGVDCWNFFPISLKQVESFVQNNLMQGWIQEKERWNEKKTVQEGNL